MTEQVRAEAVDGVAVITLSRPEKHNALSDAMVDQWREAFNWAVQDDSTRAVLVRGEGKSFCSGRDTSELGHRRHGESDYSFVRAHQHDAVARLSCPKPFVAALQGAVIGGGFEIALSADIRVSADDARYGFPEVRFGLLPDTGGTALVTALAGPSKAKLLVAAGRVIDAPTALAWGLVDELCPLSELSERSMSLAKELASLPPMAVQLAKVTIDQAWEAAYRSGLRTELLAQTALFGSADRREAAAASREGREPIWTGR